MKITEAEIKQTIEQGNMALYICPKCDEVLSERVMGNKCPACDSWTYGYQCRKRFYQLVQELNKNNKQ